MKELPVKFCRSHWKELSEEVKNQGLWSYVAKGPKELIEKTKNNEPDPLMNSCMAITTRFIVEQMQAGLMPKGCPLCVVKKWGVDPRNWIEGSVRDMKKFIAKTQKDGGLKVVKGE